VVKSGERTDFVDAAVRATLEEEVIELVVALGVGDASATAFGCDLSTGYITENAAYMSS
jgi:glutamate N-acetyltransferase/amino-acid N-acetyltransferase